MSLKTVGEAGEVLEKSLNFTHTCLYEPWLMKSNMIIICIVAVTVLVWKIGRASFAFFFASLSILSQIYYAEK